MFEELKKTFTPPYNTKDLYSIFISLFIMLAIPLTVLQITSVRDNRTSAAEQVSKNFKVSINSLSLNKTVAGSVPIDVEALDEDDSIVLVSLVVDGETVATTKNQSKSNKVLTSFNWDTTKLRDGVKSIQASATNSLGNKAFSTIYTATVSNNDTEKPIVSFVQPSFGEFIKGASYKIILSAEDNFTLESVVLKIDGKEVKKYSTVPFEYNWNTANVTAGNHTLQASATDVAGNTTSVSIGIYKGAKTPTD